jgi:hypothetical protein
MPIQLPSPLFAIARRGLWLAVAIPVLFAGPAWSQEYTVTDLGTLGGTGSGVMAVNNAGQQARLWAPLWWPEMVTPIHFFTPQAR